MPQSIAQVRAVVGGHENSARGHLDALAEDGLAVRTIAAARGRGRPRYLYTAAPGADAALADRDVVAEEYHALVRAFAEYLGDYADRPVTAAHQVGRLWGRALATDDARRERDEHAEDEAGTRDAPYDGVIGLLGRLGFSPRPRADGVVELRTCPLHDLAVEHREVICNVHTGLVQGACQAHGGDGVGVDLVPFAAPGACHLRLPCAES